jgi:phosphoribosylformimino-5-aminoimidazole carboxamide ribotide isomerase
MRIRPCIDLHQGRVKQIVGSTLRDDDSSAVRENFTASQPPAYFSALFRDNDLTGGHVIMLGPGNEDAAREALNEWPGGLQIGGGITAENASFWLDQGASHVIVTAYVFYRGEIDYSRLDRLLKTVGKERLVLDLSCRKKDGAYFIVTDRWQNFTRVPIGSRLIGELSSYADEFLVHGVDVEGKCQGIDTELVSLLAELAPIPTTYAGGARSMEDAFKVRELGRGRLDLTIGSALDIFGGTGVKFREIVEFNRRENP